MMNCFNDALIGCEGNLRSDLPGFGRDTPKFSGGHSLFARMIKQFIFQAFQVVCVVCVCFLLSYLFEIHPMVMHFVLTVVAFACLVSAVSYYFVSLVLDMLVRGVDVVCMVCVWIYLSHLFDIDPMVMQFILSICAALCGVSALVALVRDTLVCGVDMLCDEVSDDIDETTNDSISLATIHCIFSACASIENFEFDIEFDI